MSVDMDTSTLVELDGRGGALVHENPVDMLAGAVRLLEQALPDLVKRADDPQGLGLARLLFDVQEARIALQGLERDLEGITAKALMADEVEGEGVRVERRRSRDRKEWRHDDWKRDVRNQLLRRHGALRAAAIISADGEELGVDLHTLLTEAQAVTGSTAPNTGPLRALGLDPADYCSTLPGTAHVRVTRLADTEDE